MSEARALTNFAGNSVATVLIGHWTGTLDRAQLDRVLADAALRRSLGAAAREKVAVLDESRILDRWERLLADVLR